MMNEMDDLLKTITATGGLFKKKVTPEDRLAAAKALTKYAREIPVEPLMRALAKPASQDAAAEALINVGRNGGTIPPGPLLLMLSKPKAAYPTAHVLKQLQLAPNEVIPAVVEAFSRLVPTTPYDSDSKMLLSLLSSYGPAAVTSVAPVTELVFGEVPASGDPEEADSVFFSIRNLRSEFVEFAGSVGQEGMSKAVTALASCLERQRVFGIRRYVAEAIDELVAAGALGAEAALPQLHILQSEIVGATTPEAFMAQLKAKAQAGGPMAKTAAGLAAGGDGVDTDALLRSFRTGINCGPGISKSDLDELIARLEAGASIQKAVDAPVAKYDVLFSGKITRDRDPEEVKKALSACFKLDESATLKLFSGKPILVKRDLCLEAARKVEAAFQQAGAICTLRPIVES